MATPITVFATGYSTAAPNEQVYIAGSQAAWSGQRPPLILAHGSGDSAAGIATTAEFRALAHALAQDHLVVAGDFGGDTWGNDAHLARIGDAITFAANLGAVGKPRLVGLSMGGCGVLGYARANPTAVDRVAGIIPALDLADMKANRGFGSQIDAAYPPAYNDSTDGPTRSPVKYAATMRADLPVMFWTASDDVYTVPSTADAFVTARPQTGRTNLGAVGHTPAAAAAATPAVVAWLTT